MTLTVWDCNCQIIHTLAMHCLLLTNDRTQHILLDLVPASICQQAVSTLGSIAISDWPSSGSGGIISLVLLIKSVCH